MELLLTTVLPTTDLTSLITTVASSTAALVAIIGGFLVSRVISLSSDHGTIKRRMGELTHDINSKENILADVGGWLLNHDLKEFVTPVVIEYIVDELSLDEILSETKTEHLTKEEIEPTYNRLCRMKDNLYRYINFKADDFDLEDTEFNDLKDDAIAFGIKDINDHDWWYEMLYDEIVYRVLKSTPEPQYSGPGAWALSRNAFNFSQKDSRPAERMKHLLVVKPDYTIYNQKIDEKSDAKYHLDLLQRQYGDLEQTYKNYVKPKGVISGLLVLVYASIVSIAYPLTLLPYPIDYYDDGKTKWLILSLFFSQFLLLFIYLFWQVRQLSFTKKSD